MTNRHNPPAFPRPAFINGNGLTKSDEQEGMTLRDYFAGQALAGFATALGPAQPDSIQHFARAAYVVADAMLAERAKPVVGAEAPPHGDDR